MNVSGDAPQDVQGENLDIDCTESDSSASSDSFEGSSSHNEVPARRRDGAHPLIKKKLMTQREIDAIQEKKAIVR